jgi:hypothetical protein
MREKWNKDHCEVRDYLVGLGFSCHNTLDEHALNVYRYGEIEVQGPKIGYQGLMPVRAQVRQFLIVIFGDPYGKWLFSEPFYHGGRGKFDLERKISIILKKENYFRFLRLQSEDRIKFGEREYSQWLDYINLMRSVGALPKKKFVRPANLSKVGFHQ